MKSKPKITLSDVMRAVDSLFQDSRGKKTVITGEMVTTTRRQKKNKKERKEINF